MAPRTHDIFNGYGDVKQLIYHMLHIPTSIHCLIVEPPPQKKKISIRVGKDETSMSEVSHL